MTTLHNLLNSNLAKQNIAINTKRKIHFFRNLNLFKKNDRIYTIFAKRFKKERKTVKFLRLKCTSLYLYPLINVIFFGRNVINDFPGNLFIYQLLALPTLYIFKSTFLLIFFYIGLIAGIVYNRRIDKTVRSHAALSNFLDISLLIFLISKSIFPPYFKWSIAQPLLDCILYTFYVGCTIYCLVYASMGKVPTLPKSIQKCIIIGNKRYYMTTNLNMLYKSRNEIFFTNLESFFSWKTFITNKHILFNIQIYIILRILYSFKLSYCLKSRLVNAPAHQNVKSIYSFKAKTLNKTQTDIKNDTKYYKFRIKKMKYLKIYYWKRIKTRISSG